jgi:arsenate reductase (glutaredoxin)
VKKSAATRAAERFFKERGVAVHFVDLKQRPMSPGEIQRFIERFTLRALLDTEGKAAIDTGLKYLKLSDSEILARIERDPQLLRLPLIRAGKKLSIGHDEDSWKAMLAG